MNFYYDKFLRAQRKIAKAANISSLSDEKEKTPVDTFRLTIKGKLTEHFGNAKSLIITVTSQELSIVEMDYIENLESGSYMNSKTYHTVMRTPADLCLKDIMQIRNRPDGHIVDYRDGVVFVCEWLLQGRYEAKMFFTVLPQIEIFCRKISDTVKTDGCTYNVMEWIIPTCCRDRS